MDPPRINPPELFSRIHKRVASLSPSRSPTRQRITDDILADLSPATTLEAFTNPSGKLRASVEAATPSERAFGIRATLASKKIQEWVDELSRWPWPSGAGSAGFEVPAAKRRRISSDERTPRKGHQDTGPEEEEYIGSLPAEEVARYENRIDDIHEDMDDLDVEEIKSTVLNTHFSPKSRPSSSGSNAPVPSMFSSYTRMDDFTAVVTATVLQALPNLSRLTRLMDLWTVRLLVLRKVPPLLHTLDDAEVALKSGWRAIETSRKDGVVTLGEEGEVLERKTFNFMRDMLQHKVTVLGRELDYMLDTLEGAEDTLPDIWLDRMEVIEKDYGEWVVRGDRKVRAGEWAKMAKSRKAEEDRLKAAEEARTAARLQAEKEQRERDEKLRIEQEERARLEMEQREAAEALRLKQEAADEAARQAESLRKLEEGRIRAEEEVARQEAETLRLENEERIRLEQVAASEAARQAELQRREEVARLERERRVAEEKLRLEHEAAIEAARQAELAQKLRENRQAEEEASRAERLRAENERQIILDHAAAEAAKQTEFHRQQEEARVEAEEEAAYQESERRRLEAEKRNELEQKEAADFARKQEQFRGEEDALREAERREIEDKERSRLEEVVASESEGQVELIREQAGVLQREQQEDSDFRLKAEGDLKAQELTNQATTNESTETKAAGAIPALTSKDSLLEDVPDVISRSSVAVLGVGAAISGVFLQSGKHETTEHKHNLHAETSRLDSVPLNGSSSPTPSDIRGEAVTVPDNAPGHQPMASIVLPTDNLSSSQISRLAAFDGNDEIHNFQPRLQALPQLIMDPLPGVPSSNDIHTSSTVGHPITQRPETPRSSSFSEKASTPGPSTPRALLTTTAHVSPPTSSTDGVTRHDEKKSLKNWPNMAQDTFDITQFGMVAPTSPGVLTAQKPSPPQQFPPPQPYAAIAGPLNAPKESLVMASLPPDVRPLRNNSPPLQSQSSRRKNMDPERIVVEPPADDVQHLQAASLSLSRSVKTSELSDTSGLSPLKRNLSIVSGYSISDPSPEIQEAEPAEYFRPILSPIRSAHATSSQSVHTLKAPLPNGERAGKDLSSLDGADQILSSHTQVSMKGSEEGGAIPVNQKQLLPGFESDTSSDSGLEMPSASETIARPELARKTSIARISTPIRKVDVPSPSRSASTTPAPPYRQPSDAPSSPVTPCCSLSPMVTADLSPEPVHMSPSKAIVRSRIDSSTDHSTSSPPPIPPMSPRRPSHVSILPLFNEVDAEAESRGSPSTPIYMHDAPIFDNLKVSDGSVWSSPKKSSDDHIQAQISSLLESIPARIRLTSELGTTPSPTSDALRPPKTRRSVTPSLRPHSSMSTRATTPSFTLAPAYGKGTSRPRPQNGNPEIKLYHLSRSTGEAPIKLFVRLVGENGERVMVRVGGGWADLGEYLREYASHHGRRSAIDTDKVEVQDIRARVSSTSSTTSSNATIRGNGRSSPTTRPGSAYERPMSSLHIRKTRRSVGETDSSTMTIRNPSTPLPMSNRGRDFVTPPSEKSRSSSRLSWTEDEGGLGLAGPKSKKVAISERDQEWVESMKEKVRLASAEKDKYEARQKERKSFGETDRLGGTKRLFRKK